FFPDQLDYGLQLAAAQISAGRGAEALATVGELRRLPAPSSQDPRIDLSEADAAVGTADYRRMQLAASRAAEKARAQGARLLAARAQSLEGRAYWRLGEAKSAMALLEAARNSYRSAGDQRGEGEVLHQVGVFLHWTREDMAGARRAFEEALDL